MGDNFVSKVVAHDTPDVDYFFKACRKGDTRGKTGCRQL
jgi:hypothetical protein